MPNKSYSRIDSWIQFGIFLVGLLPIVGGVLAWCDSRYAHSDVLNQEIEARKELKGEVDALYLKLIPDSEKHALSHPGEFER